MLVAEPVPGQPESDLVAGLWNEVHSVDAILAGLKVAVLVDRSLRVRGDDRGPVLVAWPDRRRRTTRKRRLSVEQFLASVDSLSHPRILLAEPDFDPRIEAALQRLGFERRVPRQVSGYWYSPDRDAPAVPPGFMATGAVLPAKGQLLDNAATCLDLVPVDDLWYPLSEQGVHSYDYARGLQREEAWAFAPEASEVHPWATRYAARFVRFADAAVLEETYGVEAARRAAADRRYVELELVRAE